MSKQLSASLLREKGKLLKYDALCGASLISYEDVNYVVFFNNDFMTQEEDNQFGPDHATFPDEN